MKHPRIFRIKFSFPKSFTGFFFQKTLRNSLPYPQTSSLLPTKSSSTPPHHRTIPLYQPLHHIPLQPKAHESNKSHAIKTAKSRFLTIFPHRDKLLIASQLQNSRDYVFARRRTLHRCFARLRRSLLTFGASSITVSGASIYSSAAKTCEKIGFSSANIVLTAS